MKKSFAIIGLGRFGKALALELQKTGAEVLAIDVDKDVVNLLSGDISHIIQADMTDESTFLNSGVTTVDTLIICFAEKLSSSIIISMLAKEAGIKNVIARASNTMENKVLKKIGVNDVISPERDMGIKFAHVLLSHKVLDHIFLSEEHAITSVQVPVEWVGKTIAELDIRAKYKINIISVSDGKTSYIPPETNRNFMENDIISVVGDNEQINKFESEIEVS